MLVQRVRCCPLQGRSIVCMWGEGKVHPPRRGEEISSAEVSVDTSSRRLTSLHGAALQGRSIVCMWCTAPHTRGMMLVGGDRKVCRWLLNVGSCMLLADGTMLAGGGATRSRCPAQGILLGAGGSRGLSSGGGHHPP